jgi:membrane fusion protein
LFRKQAAESQQKRWFGPVQLATPPSSWTVGGFAAGVLLLLGLTTVVVEIPDRVRAVGVLLPVDGLLKVRASRPGRIEQVAVRSGVLVVEGQPLMRISGNETAPGRQPEPDTRIASLLRELGSIDAVLEREAAAVDARIRLNRERLALTRERIEVAEFELQARQRQAALVNGRAQRVAQLAGSAVLAEHLAEELAATALRVVAERQVAHQRVLDLQDELLTIEQQIEQDRKLPAILREQAGVGREEIKRQIAASELRSAIQVNAPASGTVSGLVVRAGDVVTTGDLLLTLHDPESVLEARIYLGADSAGMITAGQRVELQLQAYPHQYYGTRAAIVYSVSAVALPAEEIDPGVPISGPVFEVRASLRDHSVKARGRAWTLQPGTSFTADLVRHRWPLYRWLWRSMSGDASNS